MNFSPKVFSNPLYIILRYCAGNFAMNAIGVVFAVNHISEIWTFSKAIYHIHSILIVGGCIFFMATGFG